MSHKDEAVKHFADAEECMRAAWQQAAMAESDHKWIAQMHSANAQVAATLALVEAQEAANEQARIANIIALHTAHPDPSAVALDEFADEAYDHMAGSDIRRALGFDVAALGIGGDA